MVTCKELCGSLIDIHDVGNTTGPENIIKIVHETAREYLLRRKWLDLTFEHARLAIFCSRYLTSAPFAYGINEEDIVEHAVKGYYSHQDYAVQYWFDHFRESVGVSTTLDPNQLLQLTSGARTFLQSYGLQSKMGNQHDTMGTNEVVQAITEIPRDSYERNRCLDIEHRTIMIRKMIETLHQRALDHTAQEILTNLHGRTGSYKCTKPWCEYFTVGFENAEDRKQHTNRHDRPFRCPLESCFAFQLGYDTRAKLDQHNKCHHPEPENKKFEFHSLAKKKVNLWTAAKQGNLAAVGALLDSGTNVNERSKKIGGETLLYLAVKSGYFEMCKMLLRRGADVDCFGQDGRAVLHAAVASGNLDIVHLLVNYEGCYPDPTDRYGRSPFCEACALGHLDIVKLLVETGKIDIDRRPTSNPECCNGVYPSRPTPFGYACGEGHLPIVEYLLQQGQHGQLNVDILITAYRQGHEVIADLLHQTMAKLGPRSSHGDSVDDFWFGKAPSHYKRERDDWSLAFNSAIPLSLDVELLHNVRCKDPVTCIKFSPSGEYLAVGQRYMVEIYITASGERHGIFDCRGGAIWSVNAVCFSSDGNYLASGGEESIQVWDIGTRTVHRNLWLQCGTSSLSFASDDQTIVFIDYDNTIRVWDIDTQASLTALSLDQNEIRPDENRISPDGNFIAISRKDDGLQNFRLQLWNIHTSQFMNLGGLSNYLDAVQAVSFSPNGRHFVGASFNKLRIWYLEDLENVTTQRPEVESRINLGNIHQPFFDSVALTSEAQWAISNARADEILLWDCHTGQKQLSIREHEREGSSVYLITTSQTGDLFATASQYGQSVRIWRYIRL